MQIFRFVWSFGPLSVIYVFLVVVKRVSTDSSHGLNENKPELSQVVHDLGKPSRYHGKSYKELLIIFGMDKNKKGDPTPKASLKQVHNGADITKDLADKDYDREDGNKVRSLGQAQLPRKSQEVVKANSNEIDGVNGKRQFHDGHVDLATGREYTGFSTVKTTDMFAGSRNVSQITKGMSWKEIERQKFSRMVRESPMLLGAGVGVSGSLIVALIVTAIYLVLKRRRTRCTKLQEVSFGTPKEEKPIYIKLSQLHRPKRSPNYVVTVLDESNFSVDSDVSSEEELFDLSAVAGGSPCKKNNLNTFNMTSTPKKDNRFT
ncbi:uncharacterized protein LOC124278688 [Haliotis rubra]|uniref:uncharacterized protein LOC124278688 n=1 Tax=Haliotis rubra TaxID=36100 RepID=UPI001EE4F408|nr:uncharacterized protein LOC124278688 [Haliotis rubra]